MNPSDPATDDWTDAAESDLDVAMDQAIRWLARREHTRHELTNKLRHKGFDVPRCERVVQRLVDRDLLSDDRFTESYVRARIRKGDGPLKIRRALMDKGVAESRIDEWLTRPCEFWLGLAETALEKRFGTHRPRRIDEQAEWNRAARFLAARGFPSDLIYRALDT